MFPAPSGASGGLPRDNLGSVGSCPHCYFVERGKKFRVEAEGWKAEKLLCIAGPILKLALEMEALALSEPKVCCGEARKPVSKWLEKLLKR